MSMKVDNKDGAQRREFFCYREKRGLLSSREKIEGDY